MGYKYEECLLDSERLQDEVEFLSKCVADLESKLQNAYDESAQKIA